MDRGRQCPFSADNTPSPLAVSSLAMWSQHCSPCWYILCPSLSSVDDLNYLALYLFQSSPLWGRYWHWNVSTSKPSHTVCEEFLGFNFRVPVSWGIPVPTVESMQEFSASPGDRCRHRSEAGSQTIRTARLHSAMDSIPNWSIPNCHLGVSQLG